MKQIVKTRDRLTPTQRSQNMARVPNQNTRPEKIVRSLLHRYGFRFRIAPRGLPGRPDIYLPKYKTVVFVHGCFWHRHKGCPRSTGPCHNRTFWQQKFAKNAARDKKVLKELANVGIRVVTVWTCQLCNLETVAHRLRQKLLLNVEPHKIDSDS
jgi:DNA mismatch endonuclease (patch repair protein)